MTGAINTSNTAKSVSVTIASGCSWSLTGDSRITSLSNGGNINKNGHALYVNGIAQ